MKKVVRQRRISWSVLAVVTIFICSPKLWSATGDTLQLTLNQSIKIAQQQSPSYDIAVRTFESRKAKYRAFNADYYPQLLLAGDTPGFFRSISSVTQPDGTTIFTPQSQALSTMQLRLLQKIPWTGAELSLASAVNRIDILDTKAVTYKATPFSIVFRQPLFVPNTMSWDIQSQVLQMTIAERSYAESFEDIAIEITGKYFDAFVGRLNVENAALNLAINDTLYQISKGRFNVGKIAENDLLQNELAFLNAQTQYESNKLQFLQAEKDLKFTLGIADAQPIHLLLPEPRRFFPIDSVKAIAQARANRSDTKQYELQKLTAERTVNEARLSNDFSATLTASAGFNQSAPQLRGAYNNLLDQQQFSLSFQIPIVQWGKGSSTVQAALADQQRVASSLIVTEQEFEQEVLFQSLRFQQMERQVPISAKADTVAQRRFDVAKERYLVGKSDVPTLFLAQSEKDAARRAYTQMLRDYWLSYYRVRRLTLYDFDAGKSILVAD